MTKKSRVAILFTSPQTVLTDYSKLLDLIDYRQFLPAGVPVILKINISWQHYYPSCSTAPWQLDGVIRALKRDGYKELIPAHNSTVVVNAHEGTIANKHSCVLEQHGLKAVHLEEAPVKWITYRPEAPMLALDKVYPEGIRIPDIMIGKSIVHLPTMKTHVFTTVTGAMKNAFGGLLGLRRHRTHSVIHETLVDLLAIQKEIHPGIIAVTDGTFAGDGPGPRAMRPHVKNVIMASADQVAIDAIAAKMMGFDPLSLKFIRLAHERGLGCGDPSEIEVVGADVSGVNWHFAANENTFASRGQKMIYWGPLKPMEGILLRSPLVPWSYWASDIYHNKYWYPYVGKKRVKQALDTEWGKLFQSYGQTG